jgi:hypothetical protein
MSPVPIRSGGGLNRFPPGRIEVEQRGARRAAIERARSTATTETIAGRVFTVLRLEDAPGGDYPLHDERTAP